MGFFGNDDFFGGGIEELFNKLAEGDLVEYSSVNPEGKRKIIRRNRRNATGKFFLNKLNSNGKTYLIFDLSGKEDIKVSVKDEINEGRKTGNKILEIKENNEEFLEFPLNVSKVKELETKFNNGILEVSFER